MSYPIKMIDGIDEEAAKALKSVGIRTSEKLLEAAKDLKGRKALAAQTGLDEQLLLKWANMADRMRIKGMGKEFAELMRHAGVKTVRDLKHRNAERLARAMAAANQQRKLVKVPPSAKLVGRWVNEAKRLSIKISY